MLGQHGRGLTRALFTRPALALARIGVTPNLLTLAGTALTIGVALPAVLGVGVQRVIGGEGEQQGGAAARLVAA